VRYIPQSRAWTSAPTYLVRDNDAAFGHVFTSRLRAMGIRDRPISPRSPWQNGYAERLIGTVRRECLDRMLIFGEAQPSKRLRRYPYLVPTVACVAKLQLRLAGCPVGGPSRIGL